jgi:transcription initiation factor TFIIA large subunit
MSNQAVGNVYQTIIEEVINSSRVDFEENGVEESVLEELRQVSHAMRLQPRQRLQFHLRLSVPATMAYLTHYRRSRRRLS